MVMDYEHAQTPPLVRPRWEIVPEVLANESLHCRTAERIRTYSGIKEDVYAPGFKADLAFGKALGLDSTGIVVTVRPPANEAHYHNPESEAFFEAFMKRVYAAPGVTTVLLPRNKNQEGQIRAAHPEWFQNGSVRIPRQAVDGLNLLWHSDLVVSGGGTMNREAAALGVPVYSIFRGKIGAVDRQLQKEGRLVLIERVEDVQQKIQIRARHKQPLNGTGQSKALVQIVNHVQDILRIERGLSPDLTVAAGAAKS
jgi:predicted glycosyltransferase